MIIFIKYLLYARHHSDAKDIAVNKTNPHPHKTNIPGNGGGGGGGKGGSHYVAKLIKNQVGVKGNIRKGAEG